MSSTLTLRFSKWHFFLSTRVGKTSLVQHFQIEPTILCTNSTLLQGFLVSWNGLCCTSGVALFRNVPDGTLIRQVCDLEKAAECITRKVSEAVCQLQSSVISYSSIQGLLSIWFGGIQLALWRSIVMLFSPQSSCNWVTSRSFTIFLSSLAALTICDLLLLKITAGYPRIGKNLQSTSS